MIGDLYGGKYTVDEIKEILEINGRPTMLKKPYNPFYKKSAGEHGPSWEQKKEVTKFNLYQIVNSFLFSLYTGSSTNLTSQLPLKGT